MKYVVPVSLEVLNTNVSLNDYPAYAPTTTYNTGDKVSVAEDKKNYFCAKDNTRNLTPKDNIKNKIWVCEPMNAYAMFTHSTTKQTINADLIEINFKAINADFMAFFNVEADEIEVKIQDSSNNEVYKHTTQMYDDEINDFADYLYAERNLKDRANFYAPIFYDATINVKIKKLNSTSKCGYIAVGRQIDLGISLFGGEIGLKSFTKTKDDEFGNTNIIKRAVFDTSSIPVLINSSTVDSIKDKFKKIDGIPCVFIGDESDTFTSLTIFGLYKDFKAPINPQKIQYTLKLEAIQ